MDDWNLNENHLVSDIHCNILNTVNSMYMQKLKLNEVKDFRTISQISLHNNGREILNIEARP